MQSEEMGQLAVYCADHETISALLRGAGGQEKVADGATIHGARLALYRNKSGLWTIVITFPDAGSCILATGDSWSERSAPAKPPRSQDS